MVSLFESKTTQPSLAEWDLVLRWIESQKRDEIEPVQSDKTLQELEQSLQHIASQMSQQQTVGQPVETSLLIEGELLWSQFIQQKLLQRDRLQPFNLNHIQAQLAEDEGILYYYWVSSEQLLTITLDTHQVFCRMQWLSKADQDLVAEVSRRVQWQKNITQAELHRLSQILLPLGSNYAVVEQQRSLLQSKRRLLISPHKALHYIPFQVLSWEGRCFIQSFALTQIPNLSSLMWSYMTENHRPMLAVENQCSSSLSNASDSPLDLCTTLYEASGIPVTRLSATEQTANVETLDLLEDIGALQQYRYLHFAAQGNVGQYSGASCLLLQDSQLDSLKIANWKLNAELVILEINSPLEQIEHCTPISPIRAGLHGAFFAAGAKKLISTIGNVSTEISSKILACFHTYLSENDCVEVALQKALKDSLEEVQQRGEEQNIYQWAPFYLSAFGRAA